MSLQPAPRDPRRTAEERAALRAFLRYGPLRDGHSEIPEAPEATRPAQPPATRARPAVAIALTCLLGATSLVTLAAISLAQVASEEVSLAAHRRTLAALAETEALTILHVAELQTQLDAGADRLVLPDYVVPQASVARVDAVDEAGAVAIEPFADALLRDGARLAYEDGPSAFGGVASGDILQRILRGTLTRQQHSAAIDVAIGALVAIVVLAGVLSRLARRHFWLTCAVAALVAGASTGAAAFLAMYFLGSLDVDAAGSVRAEHLEVARALLEVPLRNGAITAGLGVALVAVWGARARSRN